MKAKLVVLGNCHPQNCFEWQNGNDNAGDREQRLNRGRPGKLNGSSRKGGRWTVGHPMHFKHYPSLFINQKDVKWEEIKGFDVVTYGKVTKLIPFYEEMEWETHIVFCVGGHRVFIDPPTPSATLHSEHRHAKDFCVYVTPLSDPKPQFSYCGTRSEHYAVRSTQSGEIANLGTGYRLTLSPPNEVPIEEQIRTGSILS